MLELSLFSGAGGGLLASRLLGWRTIGYVENNDYCQRVLAARIRDGYLDPAPIFGDVRAFLREGYARRYRGVADVASAGFPCQPFSVAGKCGADDDHRNMWPATREVIRLVRPRFAFLENVPGLLAESHGYFGAILRDLAKVGYDARWCVLSAADCSAPHLRKRVWILASDSERNELRDEPGWRGRKGGEGAPRSGDDGQAEPVADTPQLRRGSGRERGLIGIGRAAASDTSSSGRDEPPSPERGVRQGSGPPRGPDRLGGGAWWDTEPDVGRVADGVASRVDRLRALGNGQVPAVAATAWRLLTANKEPPDA